MFFFNGIVNSQKVKILGGARPDEPNPLDLSSSGVLNGVKFQNKLP